MCGICGIYDPFGPKVDRDTALGRMSLVLRHRGPDGEGAWSDDTVSLGHRRLSVVGGRRGEQPVSNENGSVIVVCNGEIFNYRELKRELSGRGHRFGGSSDAEPIAHLYEEEGVDCVKRLNGQFAFALWDVKRRTLILARDRFGIEPLFWVRSGKKLLFASEAKALFASGMVDAEIDRYGLEQIFTFWSTLPPRSVFKGVSQVAPGTCLIVRKGVVRERKYWTLDFPLPDGYIMADERALGEMLEETLTDAVALRLRSDLPVGCYLSGGVDSAILAGIAARKRPTPPGLFSITFADRAFDESDAQKAVARFIGARPRSLMLSGKDLTAALSAAVWHAEAPFTRSAPAAMYLLSGFVRKSGGRVVLAGEGADEFLLGYDLYKEVKVRRFWAENPSSASRSRLIERLYPYLPFVKAGNAAFFKSFFGRRLTDTQDPFYSHRPRWDAAGRVKRVLSLSSPRELRGHDPVEELRSLLPARFARWDPIAKAQYLESSLLLSGALLSTQDDRMAMAHGVEVRYPYLDHRFVELCNRIPPHVKMRGLNEKYLLKKALGAYAPKQIVERQKQPFRAVPLAVTGGVPFVRELLSERRIRRNGYFDARAVSLLFKKVSRSGGAVSEADSMALTAVLTTQLLHDLYVAKSVSPESGT